jgi:hypothetical protein
MATDHFISIPFRNVAQSELDWTTIHHGTSSTATDFLELRWQEDTGSGPTGITRKDIIRFMEGVLTRFINGAGVIHDGTDVPAL